MKLMEFLATRQLQLCSELSLFSHEVKGKAPINAKSEAPLSAERTLSCVARVEAPSGANSEVISLQNIALLNNAKTPSTHIALPYSDDFSQIKAHQSL